MAQKSSVRSKKLNRKETRDLDVGIGFMEGIVRRDVQYIEALQILGDLYTQRGRYEKSLAVDRRLSQLEPKNPMVFYNLACSHSLNQNFAEAVAALDEALSLGFRDFKWLSRDPDLRQLRKQPCYRPFARKLRAMRVRVA